METPAWTKLQEKYSFPKYKITNLGKFLKNEKIRVMSSLRQWLSIVLVFLLPNSGFRLFISQKQFTKASFSCAVYIFPHL
jgi:hypothetical protein